MGGGDSRATDTDDGRAPPVDDDDNDDDDGRLGRVWMDSSLSLGHRSLGD